MLILKQFCFISVTGSNCVKSFHLLTPKLVSAQYLPIFQGRSYFNTNIYFVNPGELSKQYT